MSGPLAGPLARVAPRAVIARGRSTVQVEVRDLLDRLIASDPGLSRLRHGLRAAIAVGTTAGVEYAVVQLLGLPTAIGTLHVLLGCVVALNMATTIRENRRHDVLVTALGAPVAAAAASATAMIADPVRVLALALFVGVSVAAVWVRRFGPRWNSLGFIAWQAYFFSLFLKPPLSQLPGVLLAVVVSTTWVTLLLVTVLYDDPRPRLRRTVTALRARARAVVATSLDVLDHPDDPGPVRLLRRHLIHLTEGTLLFDAQLADSRALPPRTAGQPLRRWIVELEIGVEEVANAVVDLAGLAQEGDLDPEVLRAVREALSAFGWGDTEAAREKVRALREPPSSEVAPVRRLGNASLSVLRLVDDWDSGHLADRSRTATGVVAPAVTLVGGNLPGSQALAAETVVDSNAAWWSPARLLFTTRQAIQVGVAATLAIGFGELLSPQRFYWAAIAAFVSFAGTATRGETVRKAIARVVGTFAGLIVAVFAAQVSAGHSALGFAMLLLSIFLAFYLQTLSQTAMVFFITLMLGQLYGLLHTFSDQVLLLRLEETAIGAAAGLLTALLVLPASSESTLVVARRAMLRALGDLLDACHHRLEDPAGVRSDDALAAALEVEAAARQVTQNARATNRPRFLDEDGPVRAHRVAVLAVCASTGRALVPAVMAVPADEPQPEVDAALQALAREARRLADVPHLRDQPPRPADQPAISEEVSRLLDGSTAPVPLVRRTQRVADALGLLTPRGRHL